MLAIVTALIWATEAMRLYLVILALGFDFNHRHQRRVLRRPYRFTADGHPVHAGGPGHRRRSALCSILHNLYGATTTEALAIVLVDRAISVLSIIVFGSIAYVVSDKTRGGLRGTPETTGQAQRPDDPDAGPAGRHRARTGRGPWGRLASSVAVG